MQTVTSRKFVGSLSLVALIVGCASENKDLDQPDATGGSSAASTNTGQGGAITAGSIVGASGGAASSATSAGPSPGGAGGVPGSSGVLSTGGAPSTGGVSTGGSSPSTGGATGSGGAKNTGGTTGIATDASAVACKSPTTALITDFTYAELGEDGKPNPTDSTTFGDYATTLSGGTSYFPKPGITSDVTGGSWHLSGSVADWSGFNLWFQNGCALFDASAYAGISFTIKGTIGGTDNVLTMSVGTAANQIPRSWFIGKGVPATDANLPPVNFGTCLPTDQWPDDATTPDVDESLNNQYNGDCLQPTFTIPVTAEATPVKVLWSDLTGGAPQVSPEPSKLVSVSWSFTWSDGATAYDVDITIDELAFVPL